MPDEARFPTRISVEEARQRIGEVCAARPLASESVTVESALGRTLAADVAAPFDVPAFANSAMDGFAVRGSELPVAGEKTFRLAGEIFAGGGDVPALPPGCCVRITTGAPLPPGADSVVMKEDARLTDAGIEIAAGTAPGANVRPAGEDYKAGDSAIAAGSLLTPARLGVLASFGLTRITVSRRPRAVLLTTGDELVAPGNTLGFGQIYDSNRLSLGGLLQQHGAELLRHERVRDDPALLRDALRRAGADADIVVSSGGVSAGEADYLPRLIEECGKVHFWKVRIKPGMPFLFGGVGGALVFGLPGNPVSGVAIFLTLLKPALDALAGVRETRPVLRARLAQALRKRHARAEFQRACVASDEQGTLWVTPQSRQGSGMLRGVAEADVLVALAEGEHDYAAGDVVSIVPLPGWPHL